MSAGDNSSSASSSKLMTSGGQVAQASDKYKFGTTNSIDNTLKKVQFGATNTIGNNATAVPAQPATGAVNQVANAFKADISSQVRSQLEEISKKKMAQAVDEITGVPATNVNGKLVASVVQHLYEVYNDVVREKVYNDYEPTVTCWKGVIETKLRTELKDAIKQEMHAKCAKEGTLEYKEMAAEREAMKASLRAEESEKIQKELDEERPAMKVAMRSEMKQDIKKELRAEMWPSVRKDLTQEFIKRLTEGVDIESTDNTANEEPPVAKQAQAAPTRTMSINGMLNDQQEVQRRSSLSLSTGQQLAPAPAPNAPAHSVPVQLAPMTFAKTQLTPLEPPQTASALPPTAPLQSAPVALASIEVAHAQVAADQFTQTQSTTAPFIRAMSASSGGTSPRASSLTSTPPGSKRSSAEFLEDEEDTPYESYHKRLRYSSPEADEDIWRFTINEHLSICYYQTPPPDAFSEPDEPTCESVVRERFQSLPAKPKWKWWRENLGGGRLETFTGSPVPPSVDGDDDRATGENDNDATRGYTVDVQGDASLVNHAYTAEYLAGLLKNDPYANSSGGVASYGATGMNDDEYGSEQGSAFDGYREQSAGLEDDDEDTTLVEPAANGPSEIKIKIEDEDEGNRWLAELDSEL